MVIRAVSLVPAGSTGPRCPGTNTQSQLCEVTRIPIGSTEVTGSQCTRPSVRQSRPHAMHLKYRWSLCVRHTSAELDREGVGSWLRGLTASLPAEEASLPLGFLLFPPTSPQSPGVPALLAGPREIPTNTAWLWGQSFLQR